MGEEQERENVKVEGNVRTVAGNIQVVYKAPPLSLRFGALIFLARFMSPADKGSSEWCIDWDLNGGGFYGSP